MNVEQLFARCVKAAKNAIIALAVTYFAEKVPRIRSKKMNRTWYQETTLNEQIITKTTAG